MGGGKIRILCVDDEPAVVEGLALRLRPEYDVITESSPDRALALLENDDDFAVIISDMRMPGMNGAMFLRHCYRMAPDAVRMLLTGYTDPESVIAAVNEGHIFRFLAKPCPPDRLLEAVASAVEQHRLLTADARLMKEKLDSMANELVRVDRLISIGTVAAGIGHEINNITSVLKGVQHLLGTRAGNNLPPSDKDVERIATVCAHLEKHGRQLLDSGRRGTPQTRREVDAVRLVERVLSLLRSTGRTQSSRVTLADAPPSAWVQVDPMEIEQVLINLIGNALDAVELLPVEERQVLLRIEHDTDRKRLVLSVEDNGCGIPEEHLSELFEPYFTTKPADRGTGLGLPVVRRIVESYEGGELELDTEIGRGTIFRIRLPMAESRAEEPVPAIAAS